MELAPAGRVLSFAASFDEDDLHVAMSVYDDSGTLPVLLLSPFAMALVVGGTYRGKFTAESGKNYIVFKAVYTDNTFDTLDIDYYPQSEAVVAQFLNGPCGNDVIGLVDNNDTIIGLVNC